MCLISHEKSAVGQFGLYLTDDCKYLIYIKRQSYKIYTLLLTYILNLYYIPTSVGLGGLVQVAEFVGAHSRFFLTYQTHFPLGKCNF